MKYNTARLNDSTAYGYGRARVAGDAPVRQRGSAAHQPTAEAVEPVQPVGSVYLQASPFLCYTQNQ